MTFRVKSKNTKLGNLMDAYCARTKVSLDSYEFLSRICTRVSPLSTPLELGMAEGDETVAVFERIEPGHRWCAARPCR
jgi:hypothetical protein